MYELSAVYYCTSNLRMSRSRRTVADALLFITPSIFFPPSPSQDLRTINTQITPFGPSWFSFRLVNLRRGVDVLFACLFVSSKVRCCFCFVFACFSCTRSRGEEHRAFGIYVRTWITLVRIRRGHTGEDTRPLSYPSRFIFAALAFGPERPEGFRRSRKLQNRKSEPSVVSRFFFFFFFLYFSFFFFLFSRFIQLACVLALT